MRDHPKQRRLHDYLDELLDPAEAAAVEAHVSTCGPCADALARLAETLAALQDLPDRAAPGRDLWPGIEARIGGGATVLAFPLARAGGDVAGPGDADPATAEDGGTAAPAAEERRWRRRRVSLSLPQLYAAGLALAVASGGTVWAALSLRNGGPAGGTLAATAPALGAPDALPVRPAAVQLEAAMSELETVLRAGRDVLDPETLRTVEESLANIDSAIEEARDALASDPGSAVLNRLLANHQRARLRLLRQATAPLLPGA